MRMAKRNKSKTSDKIVQEQGGTGETRIGFLLDIVPVGKTGWTVDSAKQVIEMLRQRKALAEIAKKMERSTSGTKAFIVELRKAAEKGYTLEQYFRLNRPFATYKKKVPA